MRRRKLSTSLGVLAAVAAVAAAEGAYAFKVGTHVWLGQDAINNLEACEREHGSPCIRVVMSPESATERRTVVLPVQEEIASAIRAYPDFFRMGTIGPDAFPGIYEGQMAIHPGLRAESGDEQHSIGYGTGEFLDHLLRRAREQSDPERRAQAIAFAYGFAAHAAGDVFAHSYVNTYAGDIFSVLDGEQAVETRHMALESYIAARTPPIVDVDEQPIGSPHRLVQRNGQLSVPADFVRDALLFDPRIQDEFSKDPSLIHVNLVYGLREALKKALCERPSGMSDEELARNILSTVADSEDWTEEYEADAAREAIAGAVASDSVQGMREFLAQYESMLTPFGGCAIQEIDLMALQMVAVFWLDLSLSKAEAQKILEIKQRMDEILGRGAREALAGWHELETEQMKLVKYGNKASQAQIRAVIDLHSGALDLVRRIVDLEDQRADLDRKILDVSTDLAARFTEFHCDAINNVCSDDNFRVARERIEQYACQIPGKVPGVCDVTESFDCSILGQVPGICMRRPCGGCPKVPVPCMKDELIPKTCERVKQVSCEVDGLVDSVCSRVVTDLVVDVVAQGACVAAKTTCETQLHAFEEGRTALEAVLNEYQRQLDRVVLELGNARETLADAKRASADTLNALEGYAEATLALKQSIERDVLDLALRFGEGLRGIVRGWVADIDLAMAEYVKANGWSMVNTMDGDSSTGAVGPLLDWFTCYGPVIAGVPAPVTGATLCAAQTARDDFEVLVGELRGSLLGMAPGLIQKLDAKFREALAALPLELAERTRNEFTRATGKDDTNPAFLLHSQELDISSHRLDEIFGDDGSGKWLVELEEEGSRMSDRVAFDMGLDSEDGPFDPTRFAAMHDAQTLVALSLLDAAGLNTLLAEGGVMPLYDASTNHHVLTHAIASIDGNHPWRPLAPPYLRKESHGRDARWAGSRDEVDNVWRRYGMQVENDPSHGFKLYLNEQARPQVFDRIFLGPLAPSLYSSSFVPKIAPDYPADPAVGRL